MAAYRLYQIKNDPQVPHGMKFSGLDDLERYGMRDKLSIGIYKQVYEGQTADGEVSQQLEDFFRMFQGTKPEGYKGHSVSISDVVEIGGKYYYCDRIGWKQVELK